MKYFNAFPLQSMLFCLLVAVVRIEVAGSFAVRTSATKGRGRNVALKVATGMISPPILDETIQTSISRKKKEKEE